MALVVDMPPEMELRLREIAQAKGLDAATFVREAMEAHIRQHDPTQPLTAAELHVRINRGFPEAFWRRFRALAAKRDAGTLTPAEWEELTDHSDRTEFHDAERLTYLGELSRRRGVPVRELMDEMGLHPVRVS